MTLEKGKTAYGFLITNRRHSDELHGDLVEMVYPATGTKLVWVDNSEENKVFAIAFRTLPEDDTGVFHILEHSLLCGSERYPVKEPFVELMKGSVNTFLNAMTFSDKTVFPISSRNTKDYMNLTGIYLDAVFAPNILRNKSIFLQEGWHLEGGGVSGVVLNEMKGAMGEEDDYIFENVKSLLFSDTCYAFCSGGYPEKITDLTYERCIDTYRRFYHPSNARIYLDGDVPIDELLPLIASYLDGYDRKYDLPVISKQIPVYKEKELFYDLPADEDRKDKGHLSIGKILCSWEDFVYPDAVSVINDVIWSSNDSPLKREVLSSGLAQDASVSIDYSLAQPYLYLDLRNVADGKERELLSLINETAARLAEEGLDRKALEATINRFEFSSREVAEPAGVERCIDCFNGWLYDGDPMDYLVFDPIFRRLREMLEDGSYERILKEVYGDSSLYSVIFTHPSPTENQRRLDEEKAKVERIISSMTEEELADVMDETEKMLQWQETPDEPEILATIPQLSVEEIDPLPPRVDTIAEKTMGVERLFHPVKSNGITYMSVLFRLTDFTLEELGILAKTCALFEALPTKEHLSLELQQMVRNELGTLSFGVDATTKKGNEDECTPWFIVKCRFLNDRKEKAQEIVREILLETDLSKTDKIREYLLQAEDTFRQIPVSSGHTLAVNYCLSPFSSEGAVKSYLSGFNSLSVMKSLADDMDRGIEKVREVFRKLICGNICRSNMLYTVTGSEPFTADILIGALREGAALPETARYSVDTHKDSAYVIPTAVGYSAQGLNIRKTGRPFHASMRIAASILSLEYLWNEVRVKGGAYDTTVSASRSGSILSFSYRDPDPSQSLLVNKGLSECIREFCEGDESIDRYIISCVNDTEPLQSPAEKGGSADLDYLCGFTYEDDCEDRRQMLETTKELLLGTCEIWDAFSEEGNTCIMSSASYLEDKSGRERIRL